ncbi:Thiol:disulfide interchange protein DsbD [bioreactor metagenome]|uniref:Thiol:disulfide interchange protein DsbD n=1 Tax=bioreactor metagenome TaxID=1076179 RepID=A0A645EAH0_9ZZZZ
MKKFAMFLLIAAAGAVLTLTAAPPDSSWFTDYKKAEATAKEKKLPMFLLFTGSDWCPWCVKLDSDTLKTSKFKAYVKDKVVLVYLDFPQKTKLPEAMAKQNKALAGQYGIKGYPSIIITDSNGKAIGKLGYAKVDEFLPRLEKVLAGVKNAPAKEAAPEAKPAAEEKKTEDAKAETGYLTDFAQAKKLAAAKKLPIIALFTGSDWCGWCIKLKKETLDTQEFKDFVAKDAIFVYLDYPRKIKQPEALKKQNEELAKQYDVQGFPTTLVLNADGKQLGRIGGYRAADDYIKALKVFMKK